MALMLLLTASPAPAYGPQDEERFDQIEDRLRLLEENDEPQPEHTFDENPSLREWFDRIRISGSADVGFFGGQHDSIFGEAAFSIWDARLFIDADLGRDVMLGGTTIARDIGFFFELDTVRRGDLDNNVGELYVDLQKVLDSSWLNVQLGRFQIPLGESYLRYSQGQAKDPFISSTLGGPWWWDEGLRFYGSNDAGTVGYVSSVSNAGTTFNDTDQDDQQYTVKLYSKPTDWLHVSGSYLKSGDIGTSSSPAFAALWQGNSFATTFGFLSPVPNFDHGVAIPDGPPLLHDMAFAGVDTVLNWGGLARLWLAYGLTNVDSSGPDTYDRALQYWVSEVVLEGGLASEFFEPFYLGFRADGFGTYDKDKGYLLDLDTSSSVGYNASSTEAYSTVLGWRLTDHLTLRAQYSFQDLDLVRGVTPAVAGAAEDTDFWAVDMVLSF